MKQGSIAYRCGKIKRGDVLQKIEHMPLRGRSVEDVLSMFQVRDAWGSSVVFVTCRLTVTQNRFQEVQRKRMVLLVLEHAQGKVEVDFYPGCRSFRKQRSD